MGTLLSTSVGGEASRSQDLANQKLAILEFSQKRRFPIDQFIESRISSRQSPLRVAPTARTSWRTRVAEDRRERDVAQKPSAVAGTAQSGSIRRPEQQGKGYRTWQKCKKRCIAAADRLPCPCHEGQNGKAPLQSGWRSFLRRFCESVKWRHNRTTVITFWDCGQLTVFRHTHSEMIAQSSGQLFCRMGTPCVL